MWRASWYTPLIRRVLVRMIGFISSWVTHLLLVTLRHGQYSAIADIHIFQFTVAHALGFFLSTSRLLATDFDTNYHSLTLQMLHKNQVLYSHVKSSQVYELSSSSLHFTYNSHSQPRTLNSLTQRKSITPNHTIRSSPTTNLPRLSPTENYS
jgi:hypothetical protein